MWRNLLKLLMTICRFLCLPCKMVAGSIRKRDSVEDAALQAEMLRVREEHARQQQHDYSHVFRKKSRFDMVRLSCIIIGIEFAYSAETAFVSPTLLEIGIEHKIMTMVWSLSPMLGLILAPIMGSLSDRCRITWGRRRPLILMLSLVLFAGLILVGWGKDIGIMLGDTPHDSTVVHSMGLRNSENLTNYKYTMKSTGNTPDFYYKLAAISIVLGTVLLDFSADNCQTPARTYLLDVCISDEHAKGLSTFTIMAGFGGFFGYALGGINWDRTTFGQLMGSNVKTVFFIVAIVFVISCFITLTSFREIPLSLLDRDELLRPLSHVDIVKEKQKNNNIVFAISNGPCLAEMELPTKTGNDIERMAITKPSTILEPSEINNVSIRKYLKTIVIMPKSLKILCFTNLLSWMGHTSYCLYFTDFVGESVFMGDPTAPPGSPTYELYQAGVRFGCWGMAIFALSCAMYSMTIEKLIESFGPKVVYIGGLLMFGFGMLLLSIYPTKLGVLLLSVPAGVIYATVFTMPYLLVANYHASGVFKIAKGENVPLKQTRGLGTDLAVISSMMFVAQIIVSLSIGPFISWIGSTNAIVYAASATGLLAAASASQVMYVNC